MALKVPTPEELAELTPEQAAALPPKIVKTLKGEHWEALGPEHIAAMFPIFTMGPTWKVDDDGQWVLPEKTIGWQIAGWAGKWLQHEDGKPWRFTLEQLRLVLWWYAVDCEGRFIYRTGVLQRLKGWGKDPLLAVISLVELVGPSRFSHWDENGMPVGKQHPSAWVQVTAVSRDQTRNTMTLFPAIMTDAFKREYQIDANIELIRARGGRARLEAVTSNYRSLEGGRVTFTVLNETHHWIAGNGGHQMHETIDGNATKTDSRYLAITNAYLPGEDSVAQRMREAFERELELDGAPNTLYDTLEAHPATPLHPKVLEVILPKVRGDSVWLNVKSIIQSVMNLTISPARSRRMWFNQIVADADALYGPEQWDVLQDTELELAPGDEIVLGFDGGKTDDATALVAIRVEDRAAFLLNLWEKPTGPEGDNWVIDRLAVDSSVHEAFRVYNVLGFYSDVNLWESHIADWERIYGDALQVKSPVGSGPIAWDMRRSRKEVTLAHERLMRSIFDGKLRHDGDLTLRRHALNVARWENEYGISFRKQEESRKIDAYAALFLAFECLHDLDTRTKKTKKRTGRGWFV